MVATIAIGVILLAMILIRIGWGGHRAAGPIGWAIAVAALAILAYGDGAWGLAIGVVAGSAMALAIVLFAGLRSPAKSRRAPREAPSVTLPIRASNAARRVWVFMLVVPGAFAAAQWLAFGIQAVARRGGAADANTIVLALFLQPVLWTAILAAQMTRTEPARMIAPPVIAALTGTLLWSAS